uniref:Uncharacterized protein n=1 Tax=Arundo donax TaxID=35708 RepID=A0A0A9CQE0_ARUDO
MCCQASLCTHQSASESSHVLVPCVLAPQFFHTISLSPLTAVSAQLETEQWHSFYLPTVFWQKQFPSQDFQNDAAYPLLYHQYVSRNHKI